MSNHIPYVDFGGNGETIHLAHANGFPARSYQQIINELIPNYRVIGMNARPLWTNSNHLEFKTWEMAAEDLIRFLDERELSNIIGIGHSFGAICTMIAAQKRPDLFRKLVLIEPVILPKWYHLISGILPHSVVKKINPVVKKTLVRTEEWSNREAAFELFRNKKVFSQMSDKALSDYVNSVTATTKQGTVFLKYSKEWESQIYLTIFNSWKIFPKVQQPFIVFRGETSDTIFPDVWTGLQKLNKKGTYKEYKESGHLLPFEKPTELASDIRAFIESD